MRILYNRLTGFKRVTLLHLEGLLGYIKVHCCSGMMRAALLPDRRLCNDMQLPKMLPSFKLNILSYKTTCQHAKYLNQQTLHKC